MKTPQLLLAGLLAATALTGTASAANEIYILGAPAFRQIGTTALINALQKASPNGTTLSEAWVSGQTLVASDAVNIYGGSVSGNSVIVHVTYSGSTGAIQALAGGGGTLFQGNFLKDNATVTSSPSSNGANPDPAKISGSNPATNFVQAAPNFGLTDTFQTTTPFHGTNKLTGTSVTYSNLVEPSAAPNAIIAYKLLAPVGSPTGLNLTPSQAQDLFTSGSYPLAVLTGSSTDRANGTLVYSVGRDPASGSRYVWLAESGIGTGNDGTLVQNQVNITAGAITGYTPYPGTTINSIAYPTGNTGYPSFGNVLTALEATATAANGYFITYVGAPDAVTAQQNGAVEVSWNGNVLGESTKEGTAPANLAEGKYTFWSYIHIPYLSGLSTTNPSAYAFAQDVYNDLGVDTTTGAILTSDVQVIRAYDGAPVTETYY